MNLLALNSHSRIQYEIQKQLITPQLITAIETTEMEACDAKKTNHPTNVYTNAYDQAMKLSGFDWDAGNWPKCGKHGVSRSARFMHQKEIDHYEKQNPAVAIVALR